MVIFRPKKRSGIAVRVGERIGTWQAKRPTTHKYRVKRKETGRGYFIPVRRPNANGNVSGTMKCVCLLSPGTQSGRDKGFARSQLCILQFLSPFRPAVVLPCGAVSLIYPFVVPSQFLLPSRGCFPSVSLFFPSLSGSLR